jgi:hypothetical protein
MDCQVEPNTSRRRSLRRAVRVETDVVSDLWDGPVPLLATDLSLHGLWLESELPLEPGAELLVTLVPPRWQGDEPFVALAEVARVGLFRRQREARPSGMGLTFLDFERTHEQRLRAALRGLPPPLPKRNVVRPPALPTRDVGDLGACRRKPDRGLRVDSRDRFLCETAGILRGILRISHKKMSEKRPKTDGSAFSDRLLAALLVAPHPSIEEVGRLPQLTLADGSTFTLRAEGALLTAGRGRYVPAAHSVPEPRRAAVARLCSPMSAIFERREPRLLRAAG